MNSFFIVRALSGGTQIFALCLSEHRLKVLIFIFTERKTGTTNGMPTTSTHTYNKTHCRRSLSPPPHPTPRLSPSHQTLFALLSPKETIKRERKQTASLPPPGLSVAQRSGRNNIFHHTSALSRISHPQVRRQPLLRIFYRLVCLCVCGQLSVLLRVSKRFSTSSLG